MVTQRLGQHAYCLSIKYNGQLKNSKWGIIMQNSANSIYQQKSSQDKN